MISYKDGLHKEDRLHNWSLNEKYLRLFGMPLTEEFKLQF